MDKIPDHFIDFLEAKGLSTVEIMETSFEFKRKGLTNWKDLVWQLLQELNYRCAANVTSEEDFYREQCEIYFQMLYLRRKYEGKRANEIMDLIHKTKAAIANCSSLEMKAKVVPHPKCKYGMTLKDREFDIHKAMNEGVISMELCDNSTGCACSLTFVPLRDESGNLRTKE